MEEQDREVNFCYRCGKHLRQQALKCWFCSAPVKRVIRPPRRCPFCESVVGRRAVKCHHCGEFLDGRQFQQGGPQHVTFVIDKAVIGPQGQVMLPPGAQMQPAEPQIPMAPQPMVSAGSDPYLLGRPPEARQPERQIADSPREGKQRRQERRLLGRSREDRTSHPLARTAPNAQEREEPVNPLARDSGAQLPAAPTGQSYPLGPYSQGQHSLAQAMGAQGYPLMATPSGPAPSAPPEEDPKYRVCPICDAECLSSDSYCYHCGQALQAETRTKPQAPAGPEILVRPPVSNAGHFIAAAALFGYLAAARNMPALEPYRGAVYQASAAALGFLVLGWAFFRKRKFLSQLTTILLAILGALVVILA